MWGDKMGKITDIYKQKATIHELKQDIFKYESDIRCLENKRKSYKRWACLPPVIIVSLIALSTLMFKAATGFADWATLATILEPSLPFLGTSLVVSSIFPLYYGVGCYNIGKEISKKQSKKEYLEECLSLNEELLETLENREDLAPQKSDSVKSRMDIIKTFCVNEKDMLLELYNQGKISECERLGFSIDEIIFIKNYLEDLIKLEQNEDRGIETNNQSISLKRTNPKLKQ